MRVIKFRGKRIDNSEWVYGYLATPDRICVLETEALLNITHWVLYPIDPKTVGQFTGLLDSKGIEIYEGDIVKFDGHTYEEQFTANIIFKHVTANIIFKHGGFYVDRIDGISDYLGNYEYFQIIGNIHGERSET